MLKIFITVLVLVVLELWIATYLIARGIEQEFPPIGEFRTVNGVKMHFVDSGPVSGSDALTVLFIHGASSNLRDVRIANGGRLEDQFRVIYVDRPGHGYSESFEGSNDPKEQANAIAGLMDALNIPKAVVVGHSFGGTVASAYGVLHQDRTAGLVLIAPATHPWSTGIAWHYDVASVPGLGWLFSQLLAAPFGSLVYPGAVREVFDPDPVPSEFIENSGTRLVLRPSTFLHNARDVAGLLEHVTGFHGRYSEIKVPTVIFHGDQDNTVSLAIHSINGLSKDMPHADLIILEGLGHMPTHVVPDRIADAIRKLAGL